MPAPVRKGTTTQAVVQNLRIESLKQRAKILSLRRRFINETISEIFSGAVLVVDPANDDGLTTASGAGQGYPIVAASASPAGEGIIGMSPSPTVVITCDGPAISPGDIIIASATPTYGKKLETEAVDATIGTALTSKAAGSTASVSVLLCDRIVRIHDSISLTDGIAAPPASVGLAQIYVDSADGDLKVIFGDGTIKTLATDT